MPLNWLKQIWRKDPASQKCYFCGLECQLQIDSCPRCGGVLRLHRASDRFVTTLGRISEFIDGNLHAAVSEGITLVRNIAAENPSFCREYEQQLMRVAKELTLAFDRTDGARILDLHAAVKRFSPLLPSSSSADNRDRERAIDGFVESLVKIDSRFSEKRHSTTGLQSLFDKKASEAGLSSNQSIDLVYGHPERWPLLAAMLDPTKFRTARWIIEIAKVEQELKEAKLEPTASLLVNVLREDCGNEIRARAFECLARLMMRSGDTTQAIKFWRSAIALGTASHRAYNSLSWYLAKTSSPSQNELVELHRLSRHAVGMAPIAANWDTFAEVLRLQGDLAGSMIATRESIHMDPKRVLYRDRMKTLCDELGDSFVTTRESGQIHRRDGSDVCQDANDVDDFGVPSFLQCLSMIGDDRESNGSVSTQNSMLPDSGESTLDDVVFDVDDNLDSNMSSDDDDLEVADDALADDDSDMEYADECLEYAGDGEGDNDTGYSDESVDDEEDWVYSDECDDMVYGGTGNDRLFGDLGEAAEANDNVEKENAILYGSSHANTIPIALTDNVHFSVSAPQTLERSQSYLLDVWAHLASQRDEVVRRAKEALGEDEIRIRSRGGVAVVRGTLLSVQLRLPGFVVVDSNDVIRWDGEIGNASFPIEVPTDTRFGRHLGTVCFFVEGLQIAKLQFEVVVGDEASAVTRLPTRERRYRSAFASYSSNDRDQVLARIQGLQKVLPHLNVFLDVASLRSGQNWAERLEFEIGSRDVFYLFWSQHAKKSEWVEKEWRTALRIRGIDYIDPVPLVDPLEAPPPEELAGKLHFNDWVLAFMRRGGADSCGLDSGDT